MTAQSHFFQALREKAGPCLIQHPWTIAQINSSNINLLSRKNLAANLLERILPLFEVSEELTRYAGLQPLFEGINLLDPHYCRGDEALRMLGKCQGLNDFQREKLAGVVMLFMEIVKHSLHHYPHPHHPLNIHDLKEGRIL
ncbi:MAG TPA: hypothetical protein EYN57_05900, partial [Candidatus Lambdaproteobacteria bacterium]|nr:hypothetical protein [Candidatus Lambdaproteobacteria bacterium]